ncbi:piggyBac transposable element-derived protein 3-like isoform X2 [Lates japonicus]|uniref:PiggyBac transposable element-derived protein 3-like isoform X2 n=1 Tax=Lates japonicus TaxID=270547 RepID=A0AAD3MZ13_LATJO|nr:piggyBac transposable element-derived protein 3-like isoform X2 [Lates japonicus]
MSGRMFDAKRSKSVVVPAHPAISDDDEEDDDDVADPDFVPPTHNQDIPCTSDTDPSAKRKQIQPVVEVLQENYSEYSEDDDDDDDGDDNVQPAVQAQRPRRSGKSAPRQPGQPLCIKLT